MIRLFAIPYAFGSANIYCDLGNEIDTNIEVIPVEYSGHGRRSNEPLLLSLQEIAQDVYSQIQNKIQGEYVILGYSMGGTVAYELFRLIKKSGKPLPKCVLAFGATEPDYPHRKADFETYNIDQIAKLLKEFGGTPQELLEEEEIIEMVSPVVISDCIALRDYTPSPYEENAISVPLTVLRGAEEIELENCDKCWRKYCSSDLRYSLVPGGHFFMFDNEGERTAEFARIIENEILKVVS